MNHRLFYSALLPAFCNSTTWQVGIINRSLARFTSGLADHAKPAALCLTMLAATLVAAPAQAAGPVVSFDASTLALTNGAVVSAWGGQSAAGTPTYLSAQTPNGSPAVEFNGSDHMGNNITLPAAGGDWILVAVIKPTNIHAYHNLADDSAGARPMLWIDPAFNYELNYGGGGGAKAAGTGTGGWDVVIADSSLNQLYVNSPTANASGGGAVSYTAAKLFNFFHRGGGQTFQGQVAELRIYNNRTDFGGNFSALYNEMHAKWIAAPAAVPPYFLETFNSNTLGPNLTQLEGASVNLSGANVTTTGGWGVPKQLVATIGTNYDTIDFVAEVTVVAHNQSTCSDEVYFGLGKAGTGGTGGYPLDGPVALLRHITMWAGTCSANANINNLTIATNDIPAFPGHGTEITNQSNVGPGFGPYVLQFYHVAGMVSFFVNGVQFGPTVDASQYNFAAGAGRVFFAGVNVKFDDFSIQAIPPANAAPTANAGAVQTAQCTGISSADVAMDGSGSSDPDGDTLTYAWSWTGGSATGLSPTASFPLGTTTVTLTVDDGNGETATSNTSVTVEDTTAPTVNAGSDVIVEATSAAGADYDVSAQVSASDTCCNVSTSISPIGTYSLGANTVSVTASDCAGNSASDTMVVTVVDTTVPVLTVPANVSIEANGVLSTVIIGTATATDLFGATVANDAPAIFALGTTTVTYTATDGNGLTSTGTQTVTVADTTAPALTLPADVLNFEATGLLTPVAIGTATATDIFNPVTVSSDAPATYPLGTTVVTWTAIDANGNKATGMQNVNVVDTTAPVVTAALVPFSNGDEEDQDKGKDSDEGRFKVQFTVTDIVDANPVVTAVLMINGYATPVTVSNGQIVEFEYEDEKTEVEVENGVVEIEAPAMTFNVTGTDASGNSATASAQPQGLTRDNDDDYQGTHGKKAGKHVGYDD